MAAPRGARSARADSRRSPRSTPGHRAAPALARALAGSADPRPSASPVTVAPGRGAADSAGAGRAPAGTSRLGSLGACWPRVPAPRRGSPRRSSPRRRVPRDWLSLDARRCAESLGPALVPSDSRARLGPWTYAAQPSPASGLSASSRSCLRLVLPVWSFPLGRGSRPTATRTAADGCPAVSAPYARAPSLAVARPCPGPTAALPAEDRE